MMFNFGFRPRGQMPFMQNQQINTFAANNLSGYNNLGNRMSNNPNAYQQIPMSPTSGALVGSGLVNNQRFMNNISPFASANPSSAMMANMGFNQGNQYNLTPQQQQTPIVQNMIQSNIPDVKKQAIGSAMSGALRGGNR